MNRKEIKELIKALRAQGFQVSENKNRHYTVRTAHGEFITTLASTPSEYRGFANTIARLRRAGFVWKGR